MTADRKSHGRYERVHEAVHPGPELPRAPKRMRGKVETVVAAVPDPNPVGGEKLRRQQVSVNRLTDPLECERSFGRISEGAYQAGQRYLAVVEAAAGAQSKPAYEPSSGGGSHELAIGYAMERAAELVRMHEDVQQVIGRYSAMILRLVLVDRRSFRGVAVITRARGQSIRARKAEAAKDFRWALESLADAWAGGKTGDRR